MARSLYLHFPFCQRKCNYCDFISYPYPGESAVQAYLDALALELHRRREEISGPLQTLYLGGGTPTVLTARQLKAVFKFIRRLFPLAAEAEVSVEANPGTLDPAKLDALLQGGANRLSLGVQSFQAAHLEAMGRPYGPREAREAFRMAREAGFSNINLDLIYGLPGQRLSEWRETLLEALDLEPEHFSLYSLELEDQTPWGRLAAGGRLALPQEEDVLSMFNLARELLAVSGYEHYEISNFARPGRRCAHNEACWRRQEYVGAGAGAASFLGRRRWRNERRVDRYREILAGKRLPVAEEEFLSPALERAEALFLGLRMLQGVNLEEFERRYGVKVTGHYPRQVEELVAAGLLEIGDGYMRLTGRGIDLGNVVFAAFLP